MHWRRGGDGWILLWRSGKRLLLAGKLPAETDERLANFTTETQNQRDENNGKSEANDSGSGGTVQTGRFDT